MSGEFFGDSGREQITCDLQYFNSAVGQGSLLRRSCLTFWIWMRIWPKIQLQEGGFDSLAFSTNNLLSCRKLVHFLRSFCLTTSIKVLPRSPAKARQVESKESPAQVHNLGLRIMSTMTTMSCLFVCFFLLIGWDRSTDVLCKKIIKLRNLAQRYGEMMQNGWSMRALLVYLPWELPKGHTFPSRFVFFAFCRGPGHHTALQGQFRPGGHGFHKDLSAEMESKWSHSSWIHSIGLINTWVQQRQLMII